VDPLVVDTDRSSWAVNDLIEIAAILKQRDLASEQSDLILNGASEVIDRAHPKFTKWYSDINRAGVETVRGNHQVAITHLNNAYDNGLRMRWRHQIQHWFVLEPLRDMPEYRQLVARFEADMEMQLEEAHRLQEVGP
jgi:hypothetical protein